MHLSSAKALSLGTQNSDCYEVLTPKLKGIMAQERVNRSNGFQDGSKVIEYVMIERKLPPYSIGRIMNIVDGLISQIRQPPSISGC